MPTIAKFLIERLANTGINHIFGVAGEHISGFLKQTENSPLSLVTTADEVGAAFAADAYARIRGAGVACMTYNVGAFKVINAVACASAEKSPLVIISGAPSVKDRMEMPVLRHMRRAFNCQKQMFDQLCCASAVLDDPSEAGYEIDRIIEALKFYKQPVYIELPSDMVEKAISYDVYRHGTPESPKSDPENMTEALEEVVSWVNMAKNPVILAGVEIARFEMGTQLQKFAEKTNIPIATTLLSKSVISERHPEYIGLYNGQFSQPGVQEMVENSDCLLMFGVIPDDQALKYMPSDYRKKNVVYCSVDELRIKRHAYKRVQFVDFINAFLKAPVRRKESNRRIEIPEKPQFTSNPNARITSARLFEKINSVLDANSIVVTDVGNALYGSSQLMVHHNHAFLGHALYGTMGAAIPSALGAGFARPMCRPFVIVGDGAFQMSANELGTIVLNKMSPILFVLDNHGYATEKIQWKGRFNDVPGLKYHGVVEMVGGDSCEVYTEGQLDDGIAAALKSNSLFVISVNLDADDNCPLLQSMITYKHNQ